MLSSGFFDCFLASSPLFRKITLRDGADIERGLSGSRVLVRAAIDCDTGIVRARAVFMVECKFRYMY